MAAPDIKSDDIVSHIDIDLYSQSGNPCIYAKQYDQNARWIEATIWDNGASYEVPADWGVTFNGTKPDGNPIVNPAINYNGKLYYRLTQETTASYGTYDVEFRLYIMPKLYY
jgi:hypothetical protein